MHSAKHSSELGDIVHANCVTHEDIDDALRSYLAFTTEYKPDYLQSEYDIARCCYKLLSAKLFADNQEYVRRQILYCLLQVRGSPGEALYICAKIYVRRMIQMSCT